MTFKEFVKEEQAKFAKNDEAQTVPVVEINWTPIVNMLNGVTAIFTPLMNIMVAVVPLVLLSSVISMVVGIFFAIQRGIEGMLVFRWSN